MVTFGPAPLSARPPISPPMKLPDSAIQLQEIEARQDEALLQLEELEKRVESVLRETVAAMATPTLQMPSASVTAVSDVAKAA